MKNVINGVKNFLFSDKFVGILLASVFWLCALTYQEASRAEELMDIKRKIELAMNEKNSIIKKQSEDFGKERVEMEAVLSSQRDLIRRLSNMVMEYKSTIEALIKELQNKSQPKKIPRGLIA